LLLDLTPFKRSNVIEVQCVSALPLHLKLQFNIGSHHENPSGANFRDGGVRQPKAFEHWVGN